MRLKHGSRTRRGRPSALFAGRVLPFDESAALVRAKLMAESKAEGRSRNALDAITAATALANDCVVVTEPASKPDTVRKQVLRSSARCLERRSSDSLSNYV